MLANCPDFLLTPSFISRLEAAAARAVEVLLAVMNEPAAESASSKPTPTTTRPSREARLAATQVLRLVARLVPGAGRSRAASPSTPAAKPLPAVPSASSPACISAQTPLPPPALARAATPSRPGTGIPWPDLELPSATLAAALSGTPRNGAPTPIGPKPDPLLGRAPPARRSA